jgi:SPP1 family predicted phage head-tail adaptor
MECCQLSAANLREPLEFQRRTLTSDGKGGQAVAWQTLFTTYGEVMPLSGREQMFAMKLEGRITHRMYIRYRADLSEVDRVVVRNEAYQIRAVINIEMRNRWLELLCEQGVAT